MTNQAYDRVILVVLDSLGIGAAKDAARFNDQDANTMAHIGQWCEQNLKHFELPGLSELGLGHLIKTPCYGLNIQNPPQAWAARLEELSPGKDTTTGHWEMAGHALTYEFPVFENGYSDELMQEWMRQCGLKGYLGNKPASGTTILEELGEEHIRSGFPIVYTSGDSVFQVACHEEHFGLEKLYEICRVARKLCDPLGVGRIIARPFLGSNSKNFKRTENRRDFSVPPPEPNMLDLIKAQGQFVAGVGKIEDIFAHRGLTIVEHTGRNETSLAATTQVLKQTLGQKGLIFTNLIDFDQLHGHRRNPKTYAEALMDFDRYLPTLQAAMNESDLLILTADHGNDPTHPGSDHTREDVPLLAWSKRAGFKGHNLGTHAGFTTIARLCLEALGLHEQLPQLPDAQKASSLMGLAQKMEQRQ